MNMLRSAILPIVLLASLGACASGLDNDPFASDTIIKLRRGVCMGTCPVFEVTIDKMGEVTFEGRAFVAVTGSVIYQIPARDVAALVEKFKAYKFLSLEDRYDVGVMDISARQISLKLDGVTKTVADVGGSFAEAPESLDDLEGEISRITGLRRWITLGQDTLDALQEQGIAPSSPVLADGLACSMESISDKQALGLLQAGVRANGTCPGMGSERSSVEVAAEGGRPAMVRELLARGGMKDANAELKRGALCAAVRSGEPEILAQILALHPDIKALCWGMPLLAMASPSGENTPKIIEMLNAARAEGH